MHMGARNAQVDVIIAHTSASIVHMDTKTCVHGCQTSAAIQEVLLAFVDPFSVYPIS